MPATIKSFLHGLAEGMKYIPDILQDIAIQKQRQQQLDLAERKQLFEERVHEEGAPAREAAIEYQEAMTGKVASEIEINEQVIKLNAIEVDIKRITKDLDIEFKKLGVERGRYATDIERMTAETYMGRYNIERAEIQARIDHLKAETDSAYVQTLLNQYELTMNAVTIGAYIQARPDLFEKIKDLQYNTVGQLVSDIGKMGIFDEKTEPFKHALQNTAQVLYNIEQDRAHYKTTVSLALMKQYDGDEKKVQPLLDAYMKEYDARIDPFKKQIWGFGNYDPNAIDNMSEPKVYSPKNLGIEEGEGFSLYPRNPIEEIYEEKTLAPFRKKKKEIKAGLKKAGEAIEENIPTGIYGY